MRIPTRTRLGALVLVGVLVGCFIAFPPSPASAQRLPGTVVPQHYDLWFGPDLEEATFEGRTTIDVSIGEPTRTITIHAVELRIAAVTVSAAGQTQTATVTLDPARETADLTLPRPVPEGPATLRIEYAGRLNDQLRGFYLSRSNGRSYAVTQMEPTDARRAFPSFDEPVYKATFAIALTVDDGDTAISNGPELSDTPGPGAGKHTLRFATTPPISTYLVAMIVGDFVCQGGDVDGTPLRICATPDKQALTGFALSAARQQLRFFNEYFGIRYPFEKLDLVAVPDFSAGAMENAGAITFRERLLLIDPDTASAQSERRVAGVISHELAHQWFGDLVTMKWWNDIWLNEGFATWLADKPLSAWRADWRDSLAASEVGDTQSALAVDALASARPIRFEVETTDEIGQVFDGIAYEKTASVLRMLETYIGPEPFRRAVSGYLSRFAWGNAAGEDFWTEIARATGRPVDAILGSYVEQPGVPVLSVEASCTDGAGRVALEQGRFVGAPDGAASVGSAAPAQTWIFPACFAGSGTPDGEMRCELLESPRHTVSGPGCGPVFVNAGGQGYYLSAYRPDSVRTLTARPEILTGIERLSLLGDEWWMVRAGRHDIDLYLDLTAALADEETPGVIDRIASSLRSTATTIAAPEQLDRLQTWIRARFGPALAALELPGPLPDDPDEDRQRRRAALLDLVGGTGNDPAVRRRARELATAYLDGSGTLPPGLTNSVLQVAALDGDRVLYDRYVGQLERATAQPEAYYRFFNALVWFRRPELVARTLAFALSPSVRTQDAPGLIASLLSSSSSRDQTWTFVTSRWPELVERFDNFQGLSRIVSATGSFCSAQKATEITAFLDRHPVRSADRATRQAIERIETCSAVRARQSAPFTAWLRAAEPEP